MNVLELADELENTYPFVGVMEVAATMLRQQQAEIEALKTKLAYMFEQERNSVAFEMLNKAILRKAQEK